MRKLLRKIKQRLQPQTPQKAHAAERGQSLTELAISFTFMMFLLAGTVDLGRAFFIFMAVRDAAQEGAVYASIAPTDTTGIEKHVRSSSSDPVDMTDTNLVNVNINTPAAYCAGNEIRVSVTYNFEVSMPFLTSILPDRQLPLTAISANSILTPEC